MELGHQFANAKRENRPPTINDLWEDDAPLGPYVLTALRARELHKRDEHYIVRDGEIKIVNASTGRVLPSSRWTDDLHQVSALLAREVTATLPAGLFMAVVPMQGMAGLIAPQWARTASQGKKL